MACHLLVSKHIYYFSGAQQHYRICHYQKLVTTLGEVPNSVLPMASEDLNPAMGAFYSAPQCSHSKRCTSYSNSVCLSVCPSVCHTPVLCQNDGT